MGNKASVLSPRGKRTEFRINCFTDGELKIGIDIESGLAAAEIAKVWDQGGCIDDVKRIVAGRP